MVVFGRLKAPHVDSIITRCVAGILTRWQFQLTHSQFNAAIFHKVS
jgi:hypothetical protein